MLTQYRHPQIATLTGVGTNNSVGKYLCRLAQMIPSTTPNDFGRLDQSGHQMSN
ncbi:hypothetical protein PROFUN_13734 [Planoprotostelium fungivorum]|uniref:Uncharacterized protein n=1 Tax=Planoprotostelium fungivorum TaxID=1890364 RepID=A0A2P6MWW4_9EUKA|nr:hypothetical protein PROFUN_13734 [Planoprotostelium fungivorum]